MLDDLEAMHVTIFDAYKAVLVLSGVDLDAIDYDAVDLDDLPKQLMSRDGRRHYHMIAEPAIIRITAHAPTVVIAPI